MRIQSCAPVTLWKKAGSAGETIFDEDPQRISRDSSGRQSGECVPYRAKKNSENKEAWNSLVFYWPLCNNISQIERHIGKRESAKLGVQMQHAQDDWWKVGPLKS